MNLKKCVNEFKKYQEFKDYLDIFKPGEIVDGRYIKIKDKPDNHIIDCFLDMSNGKIIHFTSLMKWNGEEFVPYDFQKRKIEEGSHYLMMHKNNEIIFCCGEKLKEDTLKYYDWKVKRVKREDCPRCKKRENERENNV